jgi:hypothetical protein
MLASSLEGIAGERKTGETDHEYVKNTILKDEELHDKIFKYKDGIRNQLLHGKKVDSGMHGDTPYVEIVYRKIIEYFNENHGTKIKTNVKNPPRTLGLNYDMWRGWLTPFSDENQINIDLESFGSMDLREATKDFKIIGEPTDY